MSGMSWVQEAAQVLKDVSDLPAHASIRIAALLLGLRVRLRSGHRTCTVQNRATRQSDS